eukprot:gb/GEZN01003749.1/.p1 GENE.gb/GEZN01003749.1/~~gb/GEZN01003749.1/.p1  ORF type:complete len:576 (+),score=152.60 gb/GEZN01003749.1/:56-1729(+)
MEDSLGELDLLEEDKKELERLTEEARIQGEHEFQEWLKSQEATEPIESVVPLSPRERKEPEEVDPVAEAKRKKAQDAASSLQAQVDRAAARQAKRQAKGSGSATSPTSSSTLSFLSGIATRASSNSRAGKEAMLEALKMGKKKSKSKKKKSKSPTKRGLKASTSKSSPETGSPTKEREGEVDGAVDQSEEKEVETDAAESESDVSFSLEVSEPSICVHTAETDITTSVESQSSKTTDEQKQESLTADEQKQESQTPDEQKQEIQTPERAELRRVSVSPRVLTDSQDLQTTRDKAESLKMTKSLLVRDSIIVKARRRSYKPSPEEIEKTEKARKELEVKLEAEERRREDEKTKQQAEWLASAEGKLADRAKEKENARLEEQRRMEEQEKKHKAELAIKHDAADQELKTALEEVHEVQEISFDRLDKAVVAARFLGLSSDTLKDATSMLRLLKGMSDSIKRQDVMSLRSAIFEAKRLDLSCPQVSYAERALISINLKIQVLKKLAAAMDAVPPQPETIVGLIRKCQVAGVDAGDPTLVKAVKKYATKKAPVKIKVATKP